MDKHTQWASEDGTVYVVEGDERLECVSEGGRPFIYHTKTVALVYGQDGVGADDNARLIAAAPEMLHMLKACVALFESMAHSPISRNAAPDAQWVAPIQALLAKIGGQS